MGRLHILESALAQSGAPLNLATVNVYQPGTTTPLSLGLLFAGLNGATTIAANPITTGANGAIEFWVDDSTGVTDVDLRVVHPNVTTFTVRVQPRVQADLTVTTTRAQTLTNKTLTSPTITGGTASGLAFSLSDGTVGDPVAKFTSEATTGIYRPAGGGLGIAVQGVAKMAVRTTGVEAVGGTQAQIHASAGTSGSPVTPTSYLGSVGYAPVQALSYAVGTINTIRPALTATSYARSGTNGYVTGVYALANAISTTWSANAENGIIAVLGVAESTALGATVRGANFQAHIYTNASIVAANTGVIGVEVNTGGQAQQIHSRVGILLTTTGVAGTITAASNDSAVQISSKRPQLPYNYGILFARPSWNSGTPDAGIGFAVADGGSYISGNTTNSGTGTNSAPAYGIDWAACTFTTYAIATPGFTVSPTGVISTANGLTVSGGGATVTGGITAVTGALTATAGNVVVTAGEVVLTNNRFYQVKTAAGTARTVLTMNASDVVQVGHASHNIQVLGAAIGFLGAGAVVRQTLGGAASGAAQVETLANAIRVALINLGLGQT